MNEKELYQYHEDIFKPIYADMVATIGSKPEQIAFELEAALSHIAVAHTKPDIFDINIAKAYGHLQRAALDAAKIMWIEYRERAEKIILNPDLRAFAANASENELISMFQEAETKAREARKHELESTGNNPSSSIEKYYEAAQLFSEIVSKIDPEKINKLTRFKTILLRKEVVISFLTGVASSTIVSILLGA